MAFDGGWLSFIAGGKVTYDYFTGEDQKKQEDRLRKKQTEYDIKSGIMGLDILTKQKESLRQVYDAQKGLMTDAFGNQQRRLINKGQNAMAQTGFAYSGEADTAFQDDYESGRNEFLSSRGELTNKFSADIFESDAQMTALKQKLSMYSDKNLRKYGGKAFDVNDYETQFDDMFGNWGKDSKRGVDEEYGNPGDDNGYPEPPGGDDGNFWDTGFRDWTPLDEPGTPIPTGMDEGRIANEEDWINWYDNESQDLLRDL